MELQQYSTLWQVVCPLMVSKLTALYENLKELLPPDVDVSTPMVEDKGDVFRVMMSVTVPGDERIIGVDFELRDGDEYDGPNEDGTSVGCGVALSVLREALVLACYAPGNYTEAAFTLDVDELAARVESTSVSDFVRAISEEVSRGK